MTPRGTTQSPVEPKPADTGVDVTDDSRPFARATRPSLQSRRITRPSFMLELQEGSPVGEYEIQAQIGEGAMGTVYSAIHPLIGKTVAIKVLKPELCSNQASVDRFVQEAQSVNRIGHPNIVDVFSLGELPDGRAYFVMEWLRGEDLKVRLARGPVTVHDACDILDGVARALDAAHNKDIVHRDLKPDNVYLHQVDGGPMMVKLLDFGIAKLMRAQMKMEKTQTGNMLGTPRYISPEQARGVDVDHRADIYSLGVIAYEMLAGRPPFQGETAMDLVVKHLSDIPPPLSQFARVPKLLEQCVMRMLEKDPADRPSLEVVRQILIEPTRRFATLPKGFAGRRRKLPLIIGAGVLAAVGIGVLTWKLVSGGGSTEAAPVAAREPAPLPSVAPPPAVPSHASGVPDNAVPPPSVIETQGTLFVKVTGAKDAVIRVDGKDSGKGDSIKVELDPGGHDIEIRAAGRLPIEQHVEIEAGASNTVAIVVPASPSRPPVRTVRTVRSSGPTGTTPTKVDDDDLMTPKKRKDQ